MAGIYPWMEIERDYFAGKYKNYHEICKIYKMSYGVVENYAIKNKWCQRKKDLREKCREKIAEAIAEDHAEIVRHARAEVIDIANLLINQGRQKFLDAKGNIIDRSINGTPTAINALNIGAKLKMSALGMGRASEGDGETQVNIYNEGGSINFRGMSDADLDKFIRTASQKLVAMGSERSPRKKAARKSKEPAA